MLLLFFLFKYWGFLFINKKNVSLFHGEREVQRNEGKEREIFAWGDDLNELTFLISPITVLPFLLILCVCVFSF